MTCLECRLPPWHCPCNLTMLETGIGALNLRKLEGGVENLEFSGVPEFDRSMQGFYRKSSGSKVQAPEASSTPPPSPLSQSPIIDTPSHCSFSYHEAVVKGTDQCGQAPNLWKATKEYLNQRGTKIRVFLSALTGPFPPTLFPSFSPL